MQKGKWIDGQGKMQNTMFKEITHPYRRFRFRRYGAARRSGPVGLVAFAYTQGSSTLLEIMVDAFPIRDCKVHVMFKGIKCKNVWGITILHLPLFHISILAPKSFLNSLYQSFF